MQNPGTDFMPLCLTAFIFIKYCELNEAKNFNYAPYALLALLGIFSASVKLSAAAAGAFALKPVYEILKKRDYKDFIKFILLAFIVIAPFIIRNIILSGYLVYPFPALDLFNFDWKIPKFAAVSDSVIIKVFARAWGNNYAYSDYKLSFIEWFSIWLRKAGYYYAALTILNFALVILSFILIIYFILKKINYKYDKTLLLAASCGFLFLIFTAPALRFGIIYWYVLPLFYFCAAAEFVRLRIIFDVNKIILFMSLMMSLAFAGFPFAFVKYIGIRPLISHHNYKLMSLMPNDYSDDNSKKPFIEINKYKFYYVNDIANLNGYYGFPGTISKNILERIEMRGEDLSGGFRIKDQYQNALYDFSGSLLKPGEIIY